MFDVAYVMLPIFALIVLGFAAARGGVMPAPQRAGLASLVLNFALPAVIILGFTRQGMADSFSLFYVAAYSIGSLVAFGAVFAALRVVQRRPLATAAIGAMGASASNSGFIGFPVALLAMGPVAMTALPLTMLVENILVVPLALALAEAGAGGGGSVATVLRQTAARLLRMPIVIAIVVGAALAVVGVSLPAPATRTLEVLAAASAPCALFVVGGMIAELRLGDMSADTWWIAAGKLVIHPLAVAVPMLALPGIPPELAVTGILLAAVPMVTIYPLLAARYGLEKMAAAAIAVTTAAGLVSLVAVTAILLARMPPP